MRHLLLLPAILLLSIPGLAAASDVTGTISKIHSMADGIILFKITGTRTPVPACGANYSDRFAFNASTTAGQARLSVLLTAYASGKAVTVSGTNSCPDFSDHESVYYLFVAD